MGPSRVIKGCPTSVFRDSPTCACSQCATCQTPMTRRPYPPSFENPATVILEAQVRVFATPPPFPGFSSRVTYNVSDGDVTSLKCIRPNGSMLSGRSKKCKSVSGRLFSNTIIEHLHSGLRIGEQGCRNHDLALGAPEPC